MIEEQYILGYSCNAGDAVTRVSPAKIAMPTVCLRFIATFLESMLLDRGSRDRCFGLEKCNGHLAW
jgi:hypothetical protein